MGVAVTQPNPDTILISSGVDDDCEAVVRGAADGVCFELLWPKTGEPVTFRTAIQAAGEGVRRMMAYDKAVSQTLSKRTSLRDALREATAFIQKQQEEAMIGIDNN